MFGQAKKSKTIRTNIQLDEINQMALVKERRLKRYRDRVKQYKRKKTLKKKLENTAN